MSCGCWTESVFTDAPGGGYTSKRIGGKKCIDHAERVLVMEWSCVNGHDSLLQKALQPSDDEDDLAESIYINPQLFPCKKCTAVGIAGFNYYVK